jgi:hypothetical protein
MEIVEGGTTSSSRDVMAQSLHSAYVLMLETILGRSAIQLQPWKPLATNIILLESSQHEYCEMAVHNLATQQKGESYFSVFVDIMGMIPPDGTTPIILERWHLASTGYCHCYINSNNINNNSNSHGNQGSASLSTELIRVLNRRLMTLSRSLYGLICSHLPKIPNSSSTFTPAFEVRFHVHNNGSDALVMTGATTPSGRLNLQSHPSSQPSISITALYYSEPELGALLRRHHHNDGRDGMRRGGMGRDGSTTSRSLQWSLPISPFDECISLLATTPNNEMAITTNSGSNYFNNQESEYVSRVLADPEIHEFIYGENSEDSPCAGCSGHDYDYDHGHSHGHGHSGDGGCYSMGAVGDESGCTTCVSCERSRFVSKEESSSRRKLLARRASGRGFDHSSITIGSGMIGSSTIGCSSGSSSSISSSSAAGVGLLAGGAAVDTCTVMESELCGATDFFQSVAAQLN